MSRRLGAQGAKYLASGLTQLALDWSVFSLLHVLAVATPAANVSGRTAGALLGFWLNGRFTFAAKGEARMGGKRLLRFVLVWLGLTWISTAALQFCEQWLGAGTVYWTKPLIEATLAVIGFVLSRHYIYR